MSRQTIGHRWPSSAPRWDRTARCDYCGAAWRLSQLRRDASGLMVCPDEGDGRDAVTLSKAAAAAAARAGHGEKRQDPAPYPNGSGVYGFGHRTTRADVYTVGGQPGIRPEGVYIFANGDLVTTAAGEVMTGG